MQIQLAHIVDFQEILNIQKKAFAREAELYQNYSIQPLTQTYEELKCECETKTVLKVIVDNKIVASVRAQQNNHICHLNKLIVLPEYQRRGIGKLLLLEIEKYFPNAVKFALETGALSDSNIRLYNKVGYQVVKQGKFHDGVVAVFMEKHPPTP